MLSGSVDLKLYVLPDTVDEVKRVISAVISHAPHARISGAVAQGARASVGSLLQRYLDACISSPDAISAQDYFSPYLTSLGSILRDRGIEIWGGQIGYLHTDQQLVDDLNDQLEIEKSRFPNRETLESQNVRRPKTYEALQHDMTLWHFVKGERPPALESPIDAVCWAVTIDFRLLRFDRNKIGNNQEIPICVHPSNLIQYLQFWAPAADAEDALLAGILRLPIAFADFSTEDEKIAMRILDSISRFEKADDLSADTVREVMMNKALRSKLGEEHDKAQDIEHVKEALISENNALKAKIADQEKEYSAKERDLSEADEEKNALMKDLQQQTEAKDKAEDKHRKFQFYTFLACFIIATVVVTGLTYWQFNWQVSLYSLACCLLGTTKFISSRCVSIKDFGHLPPMCNKISKGLWWLIGVATAAVVGYFAVEAIQSP